MLSQTQIQEIKQHLEKAQNPIFFFDNDVDGLCSFLILQRSIEKGKGVAIKSFPDLNQSYIRKIDELNADYIFILDKPKVSKEFILEVTEGKNLPIVWIDHHNVQIPEELIKKVLYFNSFPTAEPTTYIAQKIFNRKQDLWLAMIGCIGDVYLPDFAKEFSEKFPELFPNPETSNISAFDSIYKTEIGKAIQILNFGLKDTTTNVIRLMKYLYTANSLYDILEENPKTKAIHKRYNELNKTYQKFIEKAEIQNKQNPHPTLIFFEYSGETSMSSEISNNLYFKHKDKTIVVIYKRHDKANISIRGEKALEITQKAIQDIENASGGGHEQATGAQVPLEDLEKFKENIIKLV